MQFSDLSQMLYCFAKSTDMEENEGEDIVTFSLGKMVEFSRYHTGRNPGALTFPVKSGHGYPSIPLNPQKGDADSDVRERGRLKFSADSLEFFSEDGQTCVATSKRARGVILHDILSRVVCPDDLDAAVRNAHMAGEVISEEVPIIKELLRKRLNEVQERGWFPDDRAAVLNEANVIDTDGNTYRPDRVIRKDGKIVIVDYKFGEHYSKYESQMKRYADMWRRMGYADVSAFLWYVHTGEVKEIDK
jgi:hypothetical protein